MVHEFTSMEIVHFTFYAGFRKVHNKIRSSENEETKKGEIKPNLLKACISQIDGVILLKFGK